jgi:hypothetical protein
MRGYMNKVVEYLMSHPIVFDSKDEIYDRFKGKVCFEYVDIPTKTCEVKLKGGYQQENGDKWKFFNTKVDIEEWLMESIFNHLAQKIENYFGIRIDKFYLSGRSGACVRGVHSGDFYWQNNPD